MFFRSIEESRSVIDIELLNLCGFVSPPLLFTGFERSSEPLPVIDSFFVQTVGRFASN